MSQVEGFARWNFERKAELAKGVSQNMSVRRRPLRLFSMYTGWGTAEMVANSVGNAFNSLPGISGGNRMQAQGVDAQNLASRLVKIQGS